jgi:hypothetical protein
MVDNVLLLGSLLLQTDFKPLYAALFLLIGGQRRSMQNIRPPSITHIGG